jgi:hypothetical protein
MATITVFCVADESESLGEVTWHHSAKEADRRFDRLSTDSDNRHSTVTRFDLELDEDLPVDYVANAADEAMWMVSYVPLRRRIGTDEIHKVGAHTAEAVLA